MKVAFLRARNFGGVMLGIGVRLAIGYPRLRVGGS